MRSAGTSTSILFELLKDGEVVAQTFSLRNGQDNSLSLFYRETVEEDAEFQLLIRDESNSNEVMIVPNNNLLFGLKIHEP